MAHQSFIAKYEKGKKIVLPPGIDWPDGTVVTVTPIWDDDVTAPPNGVDRNELGTDLAENPDNHDHNNPRSRSRGSSHRP
jgi:hypothetical protein